MHAAAPPLVHLTLDGRPVAVPAGTTIWEAARQHGIDIPVLCHGPRLQPVGVCRICVVDTGGRVLAASCVRACEEGMKVQTGGERVERQRRMLTTLLLADHPTPCARESTTGDCDLEALGRRYGLLDEDRGSGIEDRGRQEPPHRLSILNLRSSILDRPSDLSSPVIAVDHQACILCDRCLRVCDDVQSNEVIGRTAKGHAAAIAFDLDRPRSG
jgi:predicted molibdopterin-dependent oxidoreductase YjgC